MWNRARERVKDSKKREQVVKVLLVRVSCICINWPHRPKKTALEKTDTGEGTDLQRPGSRI